jgi:predicted nuclease of restriction endonuclease-like RecB superfamily
MSLWTVSWKKLAKIREAAAANLVVAVSERLDCSADDFKQIDDQLLWFKSGMHLYDILESAEEYAVQPRNEVSA